MISTKQFENKIFNEKCEETIKKMIEGGGEG